MKQYVDYKDVSFLACFLNGRKDKGYIDNPQYKSLSKLGFFQKGLNPETQESESILSERGREELDLLIHNLSLKNQLKFFKDLITRKFAR